MTRTAAQVIVERLISEVYLPADLFAKYTDKVLEVETGNWYKISNVPGVNRDFFSELNCSGFSGLSDNIDAYALTQGTRDVVIIASAVGSKITQIWPTANLASRLPRSQRDRRDADEDGRLYGLAYGGLTWKREDPNDPWAHTNALERTASARDVQKKLATKLYQSEIDALASFLRGK